jgi:hypothetical protein
MDTDADQPQAGIPPEVDALMRLLANLNAGAMLALCLWLAFAALDFNSRHVDAAGVIEVQGCDCTLREVTDWSGRMNVAANGR